MGGVDDIDGESAAGEAAGVGAVGVVVVEVFGEVGSQAAVADVEVAGEAGAPAFVEDRLVEVFDVAVGLRATGSLPLSVRTRSSFQSQRARSAATRRASLLVCAAVGWPVGQVTRSAQA